MRLLRHRSGAEDRSRARQRAGAPDGLLVRAPRVRRDDRVDSDGRSGHHANRHRPRPYLSGSLPVGIWTSVVIFLAMLGVQDRRRAWRYLVAALPLFPVALRTHPTNIFIAPFLLLPLVAAVRPLLARRRGRSDLLRRPPRRARPVRRTAWRSSGSPGRISMQSPWLAIASTRLIDGGQWFEFAANNARLFNGVTIYHYFQVHARPPFHMTPASCGRRCGPLRVSGALPQPDAIARYVIDLACGATWIGFYAVAGPEALRPHFERWGLCLIPPGTLILARGLTLWIEWKPRLRWPMMGAASLIGASVLTSFYVNYFRELEPLAGDRT